MHVEEKNANLNERCPLGPGIQLHVTRDARLNQGFQTHCFEGQMKVYKVTRGPHYDAEETMAVPEPHQQLLHLTPAKDNVSYRQIILAVYTFVRKELVHSLAEHF